MSDRIAMAVFYGGLAQIIAGIMEWKKDSTFAMTAFLSFGFFWLTFVGTLRINRALQIVFLSVTVLLLLLAIGEWTGNEMITKIAGWEGILVGLSAVYTSIAQVWNDLYGRVVLPLGPYNK